MQKLQRDAEDVYYDVARVVVWLKSSGAFCHAIMEQSDTPIARSVRMTGKHRGKTET